MFFFFLFGLIVDILIGIDEFERLELFDWEGFETLELDEDLLEESELLDEDLFDDSLCFKDDFFNGDFPDEDPLDDPDFLDELECLDDEFLDLSDSLDFEEHELLDDDDEEHPDFSEELLEQEDRLVSNFTFLVLFLVFTTSADDFEDSLELLKLLLWGLDVFLSFLFPIYEYYTIIMN